MAYQMAYWMAYQMAYQTPMALLTDIKARSTTPGSTALPHGGVPGLSLHPSRTKKGQGKWVLRYVSPTTGKRRNAGLGSYPHVSIALAGKLAREMREEIALGQDPLATKAPAVAAPVMPTFQEAAEQVHAELKPGWKNAKHAQQWINTLTEYAFPKIGSLPMDQLQPRHMADVLRPIWLEKAETASSGKAAFACRDGLGLGTRVQPSQPRGCSHPSATGTTQQDGQTRASTGHALGRHPGVCQNQTGGYKRARCHQTCAAVFDLDRCALWRSQGNDLG